MIVHQPGNKLVCTECGREYDIQDGVLTHCPSDDCPANYNDPDEPSQSEHDPESDSSGFDDWEDDDFDFDADLEDDDNSDSSN